MIEFQEVTDAIATSINLTNKTLTAGEETGDSENAANLALTYSQIALNIASAAAALGLSMNHK